MVGSFEDMEAHFLEGWKDSSVRGSNEQMRKKSKKGKKTRVVMREAAEAEGPREKIEEKGRRTRHGETDATQSTMIMSDGESKGKKGDGGRKSMSFSTFNVAGRGEIDSVSSTAGGKGDLMTDRREERRRQGQTQERESINRNCDWAATTADWTAPRPDWAADPLPAFENFEEPSGFKGSPLAALKADPALWTSGDREPEAVRKAAAAVGKAAANVKHRRSKRALVPPWAAAGSAPGKDGTQRRAEQEKLKMDKKLGETLVRWSETLHDAGRPMASLMAVQAAVMGIMSVHRRNALVGGRKGESRAATEQNGAGVPGGNAPDVFVYGNLELLENELLKATGTNSLITKAARRAFGDAYGGALDPSGISSVLRGVPFLTLEQGRLVWRPPLEVARDLDADPSNPTGWMAGIGRVAAGETGIGAPTKTRGNKVVGRREDQQQREQRLHPCLQQYEAYFAHRDDIDFAAALQRVGFNRSAFLVIARIIATAAVPEEIGALPAEARDGRWRPPALRGGGSPPPSAILEAEGAERAHVWSKSLLVHRFEELAGVRVTGPWGSLRPAGLDATFDAVAKATPGLVTSKAGGRRMRQEELTLQERDGAEGDIGREIESNVGVGETPKVSEGNVRDIGAVAGDAAYSSSESDTAAAAAAAAAAVEAAEVAAATARVTLNAIRPKGEAAAVFAAVAADGASLGGGVTGVKRDGQDHRLPLEVDSQPSIAFDPRYEAARYLVDLMCFKGMDEEDGEAPVQAAGVVGHPRLRLDVAVSSGTSVMVMAACSGILAGDIANSQPGDGLTERMFASLKDLCGYTFGLERVFQGVNSEFSMKADWIGSAEDECDAEDIADLKGFLTR